jgi:hypothetical protein
MKFGNAREGVKLGVNFMSEMRSLNEGRWKSLRGVDYHIGFGEMYLFLPHVPFWGIYISLAKVDFCDEHGWLLGGSIQPTTKTLN